MKFINKNTIITIVSIIVIIGIIYTINQPVKQGLGANSKNSSKKIHSTRSQSALSSNSSSSRNNNSSSSSATDEPKFPSDNSSKIGWSSSKQHELSLFMTEWQSRMNQSFVGTYNGQQPNYYGLKFPTSITNGRLNGHIKFNDITTDVTWSPDGSGHATHKLVAIASGKISNDNFNLALYFFVIENNQPIVYVSQTTNGDDLYFSETKNTDLQNGFTDIFND